MTDHKNSDGPMGVPPSPAQARGGPSLPWSRLAGKTIVDVYSHDVEPEAGGGTLFWYETADGDSVPIFSAAREALRAGLNTGKKRNY